MYQMYMISDDACECVYEDDGRWFLMMYVNILSVLVRYVVACIMHSDVKLYDDWWMYQMMMYANVCWGLQREVCWSILMNGVEMALEW